MLNSIYVLGNDVLVLILDYVHYIHTSSRGIALTLNSCVQAPQDLYTVLL